MIASPRTYLYTQLGDLLRALTVSTLIPVDNEPPESSAVSKKLTSCLKTATVAFRFESRQKSLVSKSMSDKLLGFR